jgi:hypothetical protein
LIVEQDVNSKIASYLEKEGNIYVFARVNSSDLYQISLLSGATIRSDVI